MAPRKKTSKQMVRALELEVEQDDMDMEFEKQEEEGHGELQEDNFMVNAGR